MHGKTHKSEETRNKLKESAHKLFYKKGFEATTVKEIVEDAGYAKGTFYLYWETKYDLLLCITREIFDVFEQIIIEQLSRTDVQPFEKIEAIIDHVAYLMKEKEQSLRMFHSREILELLISSEFNEPYIRKIMIPIICYINEGITKGYFRGLDAEIYGKMIFSIAHGILESAMLYGFPADIDTVKEELKVITRKMLQN